MFVPCHPLWPPLRCEAVRPLVWHPKQSPAFGAICGPSGTVSWDAAGCFSGRWLPVSPLSSWEVNEGVPAAVRVTLPRVWRAAESWERSWSRSVPARGLHLGSQTV